MRLIDADALMDDINTSIDEMTKIRIAVDGEWLWAKLNDAIKNAPTIEPERKGRWIDAQYPFGKCDKCGAYMDVVNNEANYCCVCGARMEGVEHERSD